MMKFWLGAVARLVGVFILALAAGLAWGWGAALVAVSVALSALLILHWRKLYSLDIWLRSGQLASVPEARGLWGDVFASLYHVRRARMAELDRAVASLERAYQAAGALPEGVVILDAEDRIEWCNTMASALFGLDVTRDSGTPISQLLRQPELSSYLLQGEGKEPLLITLSAKNPRRMSIQLIPFADDGRLLIARDVTVAERAETVRRDFVANVSHELRTPLTVIVGFMEHLVGDDEMDKATRQRFLQMVQEQAQRMNRLVDDLLTLSRLESSAQPTVEETVDMPRLLAQLISDGQALSQGRHQFEVNVCDACLRGNTSELRSALGNLISNAVRYTPEGGVIRVDWQLQSGQGVVTVKDSGIGIPPEHIPRLTERFYRVDKGRSSSTGGTGLGLAIVKHALQHHQAQLEITSAHGEGSRFSAHFPAARIRTADQLMDADSE